MTNKTIELAREILEISKSLSHNKHAILACKCVKLAQQVIEEYMPEEPEEVKEALLYAKYLKLIQQARAEEREEAAKICEKYSSINFSLKNQCFGTILANEIRRGGK